MLRAPTLAFAALFLAVPACVGLAAELPSQAKKATAKEIPAARKCNIGGIAGVIAANGVCVRMSGSVATQFGGQIR